MGDERLVALEPIEDVIDMQTAAAPAAEEGAYTYQRADGTVERALNAQDAISRCPVLGKLAIEAPDQANMLLELAAAGKAKMTAGPEDEPQKPKPEEKIEMKQKQAEEPIIPATDLVKDTAQPMQPELTTYTQVKGVKQQDKKGPHNPKDVAKTAVDIKAHDLPTTQRIRQIETTLPKDESVKPPNADHIEPAALATPIDLEIQRRQERKTPALQSVPAKAQPVEIPNKPIEPGHFGGEIATETDASIDIEDRDRGSEVEPYDPSDLGALAPDTTEAQAQQLNAVVEYTDELYGITEPQEYLQPLVFESEVIVADISQDDIEVDKDENEQLQLLFESETIETYELLAALIADEEASGLTLVTPTQIEVNTLVKLEPEANTEIVAAMDFETFIALQPVAEEPLTLRAIQEQAYEQPLEQTLAQLVGYFSEPLEEGVPEALWPIIQEVGEALPACYIRQKTTEAEPKLQVTPEMTEKLLLLLRTLGYKTPREELVNFATKYGLVFLLQAVDYMYQLYSNDNKQEFLTASATPASSVDDNAWLHVGKMLFGLIIIR